MVASAQQQPMANEPAATPPPGTNPAIFPSPHGAPGSDWMGHFQRSADRTKRGNVDLIFDGDSITDFWLGTGKDVWAKNYGRLNAVDYGISGDRTENMLGGHRAPSHFSPGGKPYRPDPSGDHARQPDSRQNG